MLLANKKKLQEGTLKQKKTGGNMYLVTKVYAVYQKCSYNIEVHICY